MDPKLRERWLRIFFALAACSVVPHWSCHYYRLETGSTFVVWGWAFSKSDSILSLCVYSALIAFNLACVALVGLRPPVAVASGVLHLGIGALHVYRLFHPFTFEVFGHAWSQGASAREAVAVVPFGFLCLGVARMSRRSAATAGS